MMKRFYRVTVLLCLLAICALLPACKSIDAPKVPGITPYRMVIQQGNFISQEMVAQLKPGMTKEQVRFVLGTPLVTDIFHADRWDYVFYRELPDGKREQRNLSVIFEKEKLARVLGDLLPAEGTGVRSGGFEQLLKPDAAAKPAATPPAEAPKAAETPKPAAEAAKPAETGQNWGTAEPEKKVEAAPEPKAEPKPEEDKSAEEKKEPSLFDKLREKIGL